MNLRTKWIFNGYTIREDGVVTSRFGRAIKHQLSKNGYVRVELWRNGEGKKYLLHRLLAKAFVPNPDGKPTVNHIDGDKANNTITNLEWATRSENQKHAYQAGLRKGYRKPMPISASHKAALCGSRWKNETHVYDLEGERFSNLWDASDRFGVSRQTILNRCKSERWPSWSKSVERR